MAATAKQAENENSTAVMMQNIRGDKRRLLAYFQSRQAHFLRKQARHMVSISFLAMSAHALRRSRAVNFMEYQRKFQDERLMRGWLKVWNHFMSYKRQTRKQLDVNLVEPQMDGVEAQSLCIFCGFNCYVVRMFQGVPQCRCKQDLRLLIRAKITVP